MYLLIGLIIIILGIYYIIRNLRERYLSKLIYLNVPNIIFSCWFIIYIFYREVLLRIIIIPEEEKGTISIINIGIIVVIVSICAYFYNKMEGEKIERNEDWISWVHKKGEVGLFQKIFFYLGVH
jgi:hypothetical protein